MTPEQFIQKWTRILTPKPPEGATERTYSQEHFIDLCRLIGHQTPGEGDPEGYRFEKPLTKITKAKGYADVWKRGYFGWEYKGPHKDLDRAYVQLKTYADALENPPLLVTCDLWRFIIHTNFTATVKHEYEFTVDQLAEPDKLALLRAVFTDPGSLKPNVTRAMVTEEAAERFARLATALGERYGDRQRVAHFLDRLIFCMFAEDIGLLPEKVFTKMTAASIEAPGKFRERCSELFRVMGEGGMLWITHIKWFNGGLFDSDDALDLQREEIETLHQAALLDWSDIEPAIFGTLFERGLDPDKRSQLGAHYTDPDTIMRLINPVIRDPWERAWEAEKEQLIPLVDKWHESKGAPATKARKKAQRLVAQFLEQLKEYRVLDPACGSGNFLYLALKTLKDFEKKVRIEVGMMGLPVEILFEVSPENLYGIEINPYAAELARVAVWIGELQWMIQNGYSYRDNPILRKLEQIECRDALITEEDREARWPVANAVIGNPPFLGGRWMESGLGKEYSERLRSVYSEKVPRGADLVCYWFHKAYRALSNDAAQNIGLVATQSIRRGSSRMLLEPIADKGLLYNVWQDEPWVNEGAAVRVSLICFGQGNSESKRLDGEPVATISSDLTGRASDLTKAVPLHNNRRVAYQGIIPRGPFIIPGDTAREWLKSPNPNGKPNSDVLAPYVNGRDITNRGQDKWVLDFPLDMPERLAAQYERPYAYAKENIYPIRQKANQVQARTQWWIHWCYRDELRSKICDLPRYIVTPRVSKHRVFDWVSMPVLPDNRLYAIARDDDVSFGILHSHIHEVWALATSSRHGVGNDPTYNARSCFETFPFPSGMTPNLPSHSYNKEVEAQRIANAARDLVTLRDNWLNPPEWTEHISEVVDGFPDRIVPKPGKEVELKKRTLTNLYNERPTWLDNAHRELDEAVAAAYGWEWPLNDQEILSRLLALNFNQA